MCGVAGLINVNEARTELVDDMISAIRYRGVDESGSKNLGRAIFGHARLAIVDPANGSQPMSSMDGKVWVSFNGEIFNFIELREELKAKGYVFKSRCDTEVLVHLWCEEGEAMLDRLVGMFTFAIWDQTKKKLFILSSSKTGKAISIWHLTLSSKVMQTSLFLSLLFLNFS